VKKYVLIDKSVRFIGTTQMPVDIFNIMIGIGEANGDLLPTLKIIKD